MAKMTAAQKRAALKYQKKLGQFSIKLPKQELARYKAAAEKEGMPFRAWVLSQLKKAAYGTINRHTAMGQIWHDPHYSKEI